MSFSQMERLVRHPFRLDILCCLEQEPLTILQVSARVGKPTTAVSYHVKLLEAHDLLEKTREEEGEDGPYAATLEKHPAWVSEAVRDHRGVA